MRTALERRLSVEAARRFVRDFDVDVDVDVAEVSHLYPVGADPANLQRQVVHPSRLEVVGQ